MPNVKSPHRRSWRSRAAVVCGTLLVSAPLGLAQGYGTASAGATPAAAAASSAVARPVTLKTGDQVAVIGSDGHQTVAFQPRRGSTDRQYASVRKYGDLYVVPHSAQADMGTRYTVEDFNVSRLLRIRAGVPEPSRPVQPNYVMQTLAVTGIDSYGRRDSLDWLIAQNVDDATKYSSGFAFFIGGLVKLSVPVGHYSLIASFTKKDTAGNSVANQVVVLPQFTVAPNQPTNLTVDARAATTAITASTPRPAVWDNNGWAYHRYDAAAGFDNWVLSSGLPPVFVTPTKPVTVGEVRWATSLGFVSPPSTVKSYTYDLHYAAIGTIPSNQHHAVSAGQLATLTTDYHSDQGARLELLIRASGFAWEHFTPDNNRLFTAPLHRTEYVLAAPGLFWEDLLILQGFSAIFLSSFDIYRPRDHHSRSWVKTPLHPGVAVNRGVWLPGAGVGLNEGNFICGACREGDTLHLLIFPSVDADPNFALFEYDQTATYALLKDGTQVAGGDVPFSAALPLPVTPDPATYQLVYDTVRSNPIASTLSTATHTTWTFGSQHQSGGALPAGWQCAPGAPDTASTACAILPLLFAGYHLPTNLLGQEPPGATRFILDVAHIQSGPTSPVADPSVEVSFDGGTTWAPAAVAKQAAGRFAVSYTNPAVAGTDGFAALRISAHDTAGSRLDQTILRAYAIGG
jgi:hypothetical protein